MLFYSNERFLINTKFYQSPLNSKKDLFKYIFTKNNILIIILVFFVILIGIVDKIFLEMLGDIRSPNEIELLDTVKFLFVLLLVMIYYIFQRNTLNKVIEYFIKSDIDFIINQHLLKCNQNVINEMGVNLLKLYDISKISCEIITNFIILFADCVFLLNSIINIQDGKKNIKNSFKNTVLYNIIIFITIIISVVLIIFSVKLLSKLFDAQVLYEQNSQLEQLINTYKIDNINNSIIIKINNLNQNRLFEYKELLKNYKKLQNKINCYEFLNSITPMIISMFFSFVIFFIIKKVFNILSGKTVISVLDFLRTLSGLYFVLNSMLSQIKSLNNNLKNINDLKYDIVIQNQEKINNIETISCNNLNYSIIENKVLKGNFSLNCGDVAVVLGSSGSGKTTLIKLILNIIPNNFIYINDINLSNINNHNYYQFVSYMNQNSLLFDGTIAKNLNYINNNKDQWDEFAKLIGISNRINNDEKKYNQLVGFQGCNLSGGEKQRLSALMMFLKPCDLYVLDEPTSALDVKNTQCFYDMIIKMINRDPKKIVIFVTHDMQIVKIATKIIFINKDNEICQGSHEELLETNEDYQNYWANS